jgi:hypothetical protein
MGRACFRDRDHSYHKHVPAFFHVLELEAAVCCAGCLPALAVETHLDGADAGARLRIDHSADDAGSGGRWNQGKAAGGGHTGGEKEREHRERSSNAPRHGAEV